MLAFELPSLCRYVAGFGERDGFHPIDRVDKGRSRIAIGLDPLGNVAPTRRYTTNIRIGDPLPILHQLAEVRCTELRVVCGRAARLILITLFEHSRT